MSCPPTFNDVDKSAKDLFSKGYNHGFIKFESTTKSGDNVEFKTGASHNLRDEKLAGNIDIKFKCPEHGIILTEKWKTDNSLGTVLEVKDQFSKGLKVTLDAGFNPNSGKRTGVLKTEWAKDYYKLNTDVSLSGGPIATLAGVFLHNNWIAGLQTKYDMQANNLLGTNVIFGRKLNDYTAVAYTNDGRDFGASWYQKVHKNLELGAMCGWEKGKNDGSSRFALASKYRLNNDVILRAKIDNKSAVAIAATHELGSNAKLTFTTQFHLANVIDNSPKFGVGLEYCADGGCCH